MYRCTRCQAVVPRGIRQRLLIETRPARYPCRPGVYRIEASGKTYYEDDPGGQGQEIARASPVCPACASGLTAPSR